MIFIFKRKDDTLYRGLIVYMLIYIMESFNKSRIGNTQDPYKNMKLVI